jgi:hypothetical protein
MVTMPMTAVTIPITRPITSPVLNPDDPAVTVEDADAVGGDELDI